MRTLTPAIPKATKVIAVPAQKAFPTLVVTIFRAMTKSPTIVPTAKAVNGQKAMMMHQNTYAFVPIFHPIAKIP